MGAQCHTEPYFQTSGYVPRSNCIALIIDLNKAFLKNVSETSFHREHDDFRDRRNTRFVEKGAPFSYLIVHIYSGIYWHPTFLLKDFHAIFLE